MDTLGAAFYRSSPSEVAFGATVVTRPRFFYGARSHSFHEAFDVRADDGHRLEVVDNVSLAPRVPVALGDRIVVKGEFVPQSAHGPLVHWTHHDPRHHHPDGFIELRGRVYA